MGELSRSGSRTDAGDIIARLRVEVDEIVGLIQRPICSEREVARLERPPGARGANPDEGRANEPS